MIRYRLRDAAFTARGRKCTHGPLNLASIAGLEMHAHSVIYASLSTLPNVAIDMQLSSRESGLANELLRRAGRVNSISLLMAGLHIV